MKTFGRYLLILITFEVSLGGGGRLFDTGILSPRMILFGFGVAYYLVFLFLKKENIPREFIYLMVAFVSLSSVSALISMIENINLGKALSDFKPLAYFFLLPFFAVTIRSINEVVLVEKIWKTSALILAILYLFVMAIWKLDFVTTEQMIGWLNPAHDPRLEIYFRGDTTFYFKALLYVGIGVLFFYTVEHNHIKRYALPMLFMTIGLTMTRGMWLSVFMVLSAWAFIYRSSLLQGLAVSVGLLFIGIVGVLLINECLPSVKISNQLRMNDVAALINLIDLQILNRLKWETVIFGKGFGATILNRDIIELNYLNIAYKQGLAGIVFWSFPPIYLLLQMRNIFKTELRALAMRYILAAAFVYVVSFTNPFLTNPIGMAVVIVSIVAVRVIRASDEVVGIAERECIDTFRP